MTIKQKIFNTPNLGLNPQTKDHRDLGYSEIFGGTYQPKHKKKLIPTLSVKKQLYNTCGWNSSTTGKEIDERVILSPRSFVMAGKAKGYISGDGFSTLRNNEKTLQKCGISEAKFLPKEGKTWEEYCDLNLYTNKIKENALKHRSKSYLAMWRISDIFNSLDYNRPVKIGIDWYH